MGAKRKMGGTWINTGMFTQIWKKIAEAGEYQNADWVMKLDADAIFIANRMRVWLKQNELVPPAGIYLEIASLSTMVTSAIWKSTAHRPSPPWFRTSRLMVLAQQTGRRGKRRTRSGSQTAHGRPLQRCTPSRRHRSGSSAMKPPQPPSGHK